jgi:hypothetical protein
MFGWAGTVLLVDLTQQTFEKKDLNPEVARDFLGGRGLNAKILFDGVGPGVDPLGPENILCLAPGVLSATALGLSSRLHVSTLSPYSGILGDGNVGGDMAGVIKQAGYDQIVVTGASSGSPVFGTHRKYFRAMKYPQHCARRLGKHTKSGARAAGPAMSNARIFSKFLRAAAKERLVRHWSTKRSTALALTAVCSTPL